MDNFQIICQNRSLQRWGFYAYRNGQLLKDELGQDKIRNIWNGGNIKDIDPLFKEYSKLYPENIYIIFKSDGAHFATFLNDENKLIGSGFVKHSMNSLLVYRWNFSNFVNNEVKFKKECNNSIRNNS